MTNQEAIEMMQRCRHEIIILRQQLDHTRPKAEAYDNLSTLLSLLPRPSVNMGEDFVWTLDKRIAELKAHLKES